ncbi:hypothetical protein CHS0354_035727 [Potamilus streckersoni]|uniref:Uncharacterized protein n=1 Tax=Potamilus streckersoni TaxID=2493646 RepID=A0AAE0S021_9BIVA|nr:hypothetical protein CHS0354_035727 [Potamilus streckersoni]
MVENWNFRQTFGDIRYTVSYNHTTGNLECMTESFCELGLELLLRVLGIGPNPSARHSAQKEKKNLRRKLLDKENVNIREEHITLSKKIKKGDTDDVHIGGWIY